jgi:hypothetical protein
MTLKTIFVYLIAGFLILYGLRSFIAGIKKEKRSFWITMGYDKGLRDLFKDKYDQVLNIIIFY